MPTAPEIPDLTSAAPVRFRSGYVAIIGAPNSGKSTLLNRLLRYRVSIVAPRPQTTRHRVTGILNGPDFQAVLLDTPGLLSPRYRLHEYMKREIDQALADADVVLLVVDAVHPRGAENVPSPVAKTLVVLNKIDAVQKKQLLPLASRFAAAGLDRVHMASALRGSGIGALRDALVAALPEGPAYYPEDMVSDRPERFFAAEFVREAVFNRFGAEIPYCVSVTVEEFVERPGRKDFIRAVIHVERESQKSIVIGENGRALKKVGESARRRLEAFLGRQVFLELWVNVAKCWRQDDAFIREKVYGRERPDAGS